MRRVVRALLRGVVSVSSPCWREAQELTIVGWRGYCCGWCSLSRYLYADDINSVDATALGQEDAYALLHRLPGLNHLHADTSMRKPFKRRVEDATLFFKHELLGVPLEVFDAKCAHDESLVLSLYRSMYARCSGCLAPRVRLCVHDLSYCVVGRFVGFQTAALYGKSAGPTAFTTAVGSEIVSSSRPFAVSVEAHHDSAVTSQTAASQPASTQHMRALSSGAVTHAQRVQFVRERYVYVRADRCVLCATDARHKKAVPT